MQPGCFLTFDQNTHENFKENIYWRLDHCFRNKRYKNLNFKNAKEQFSELMNKSLISRSNSDVTIGTYLSGE